MDTMMDRQKLDAFADGALSPEESARIVMHLADCPTDSAYVDAVMEANELLAAAYARPLYEPLPERFRSVIFPAAEAAPARPPARSPAWRGRGPMRMVAAAAISAALALVAGVTVAPVWRGKAGLSGADPVLLAALENDPSGAVPATDVGARITLIGTFFDRANRPCRQFEALDRERGVMTKGLACRDAARGWETEISAASRIAGADAGEGYVPADGAAATLDQALDATLDKLGAGMMLPPKEEQALIAGDWSR